MKRSFFKLSGLLLIIAFSLSYISNTFAAPAGFSSEIFMSSLNEPISITFAPDNRMFIVTRLGTIHVAQPGSNQIDPTPFLQLPNIDVTDAENGSYSLIFDPNFSSNNYFYVFYTSNINGVIRDRVSRFTANGNTTDPNTELVLWQDLDPPGSTHHGGSLAFDSSGYLYIGVGEHFFPNLSQDTNSYRGKILRIRTDGTAPSDNPFYIGDGQPHDFVWAWGIRQPFKLHYDQPTGRLFLGEVGGNVQTTAIEEVNLITKGANYGWPTCEGTCGVAGMTNPIFSYPHGGINAAVVGGFVYRGTQFPSSYVGDFFYGDYVRAWIQNLNFDSNGNVTGSGNFEPEGGGSIPGISIVDVKQGPEGALYYVDYNYNFQGTIRRIKYNLANQAPVVVSSASSSSSTTVPFTVDFSSFGTFDPEGQPLTYAWNFGDGNNSTQANPSHTYNQKGHYSVVVSVSDGTNTILGDPIEINVGNPPTPVISSPTTNSTFIAGETINFSGSASDVEDGSLADSTLTWIVRFGHD
ncbi:PQQ-dependent sugar dehydrogenase, partial [Candidatus Gottesmanbacteria bacterium]|nr:PQQ-dependent sugar dehydrogenase [Candidatus Gottesmanbacteria bacterium]